MEHWIFDFLFFSLALCVAYVGLLSLCAFGWFNLNKVQFVNLLNKTYVTVIVAARNEQEHIGTCIEHLLLQDYHSFEIIVVDDDSADSTAEIIELFQARNLKIKITLIRLLTEPGIMAPKKRAITEAIKQGQGSLIVTTDADCIMGKEWLTAIVSFYESSKAVMIAGPVAFHKEQSIFEKLQSLEFSGLMAVSGGSIYYQLPLMCNGANLAYEKQAFIDVGGFQGVDNIASGDDVLLMRKIAKKFPLGLRFLKLKQATVYTLAQTSVKDFFQQRRRWASKSFKMINFANLVVASIVFSFNFSLIVGLFLSCLNSVLMPFFFVLVVIKCIIDFLLLFLATSFFGKKSILWLMLPVQLLYVLYIVFTGFYSLRGKYQWKGRRLN